MVSGRQGESKLGDNKREDNLQLDHRKVFAQADARTQSEWYIGLGKLASLGDTVAESLWFELIRVRPPNIVIPVQRRYQSPQAYILGNDNISKLGVFQCLS